MKTAKVLKRACAMASVATATLFLSSLVNATGSGEWETFVNSYFGYTRSAYEEVVRDYNALNMSSLRRDGSEGGNDSFNIAPPKSYVLRNGAGTLTVTAKDILFDVYFVEVNTASFNGGSITYLFATATIETDSFDPNNPWALQDPQIKKYANHLWLQVSSQLICPNESYNSNVVFSALSNANTSGVTGAINDGGIALPYCPEGGYPIAVEAQFDHGVM